jgi:hypothetical protein
MFMKDHSTTSGYPDCRVETPVHCDRDRPVESRRDGVVPSERHDPVWTPDLQRLWQVAFGHSLENRS